jgi:hypothetical protein
MEQPRNESFLSIKSHDKANEKYGYLSTFMVHADSLMAEIDEAKRRIAVKSVCLASATSNLEKEDSAADSFLGIFETELVRVTDYIISVSAKALLTNSKTPLSDDAKSLG